MVIEEASIDNTYYTKGLNSLIAKDLENARFYFKKSIEEYPNEPYAYYQLMLDAFFNQNFELYKNYAKKLSIIDNGKYIKEAKYLVYLLKYIKNDIKAEDITYEDIMESNDTPNAKKINEIRKQAIQRNIGKALRLNTDLYFNGITVFGILEKKLLERAKDKEQHEYNKMLDLIIIRKYSDIIKEIDKLEEEGINKKIYRYLKILSYDYLKLKRTGHLDNLFNNKFYKTYYDAIDNKDYKAAIKILSDFNKSINVNNENNLLHIALCDICFLRKLIKNTRIAEEEMKKQNIFDNEVSKEHLKLIQNRGIVILPKGDINKQLMLAKIYNDNTAFTIDDEAGIERVVLKFKDPKSENKIEEAEQHYKKQRYPKAIRAYLNVLECGKPYSSFVYTRLGISYLKLHDKEKALPYLIVANDSLVKNKSKYNLVDLINKTKGVYAPYQDKPYTEVELEEFDKNVELTDDATIFNKVYAYILENNVDVETASKCLNLDEYQTNIVKLMFAIEFYKQKEHAIGDMFVKSIDQKYKNDKVREMLNEINSRKKFYANRNEDKMDLPITLKPKNSKRK